MNGERERKHNGAELKKWSGVKKMERSEGNLKHDPKGGENRSSGILAAYGKKSKPKPKPVLKILAKPKILPKKNISSEKPKKKGLFQYFKKT